MQTFIPFEDVHKTASCLDRQRLGKQRVETKQIINTLLHGGGWENHPAVKMWDGCIPALCYYGMAMCLEWKSRGYVDNLFHWFNELFIEDDGIEWPIWWGHYAAHDSHKAMLLNKDYQWYSYSLGLSQYEIEGLMCQYHTYYWPAAEVITY